MNPTESENDIFPDHEEVRIGDIVRTNLSDEMPSVVWNIYPYLYLGNLVRNTDGSFQQLSPPGTVEKKHKIEVKVIGRLTVDQMLDGLSPLTPLSDAEREIELLRLKKQGIATRLHPKLSIES